MQRADVAQRSILLDGRLGIDDYNYDHFFSD